MKFFSNPNSWLVVSSGFATQTLTLEGTTKSRSRREKTKRLRHTEKVPKNWQRGIDIRHFKWRYHHSYAHPAADLGTQSPQEKWKWGNVWIPRGYLSLPFTPAYEAEEDLMGRGLRLCALAYGT